MPGDTMTPSAPPSRVNTDAISALVRRPVGGPLVTPCEAATTTARPVAGSRSRPNEAEFGARDPEYVQCPFVLAPAAVLAGDVDAAVWHSMPTVIPPELAGLKLSPLATPAGREVVSQISAAVIVTRALDPGVNALLRHVKPADVTRAQSRLLKAAATEGFAGTLRLH
jgi:hypothetical protein